MTSAALAPPKPRGRYAGGKRPAVAGTDAAINIEFRQMLRPAALKRNLSVDALIVLLIEKIAEDRLVDAVLDDAKVSYK
ncbi:MULTISPECIES: hypothetical protein [Rhizobium]|uniref:hypothetical protein n=1 Tax=Rhizobium TaxID=379 RepID=UPI001030F69B|nr:MULTISPECIES: hypothetical protein [Rhizobium]MBB4465470.1 hypothetical protein [Rhizobium leguminosarum]MBB4472132.1 hypothetical protein [Rhizobium leguminosarum]MBY5416925.1 hypothetical protein [Rhizobium leguminosarum]TAU06589.1 hypothetical protein ELI55_17900 [Rhizobium ruizarguesonis]TAZ41465.1 hypothetical protein ELH74_19615 [Rhizobium ruizarguesonis]